MWWPIRNQIFVPFTAVLLVAVMLTALAAGVDAARRAERATAAQLNEVIGTLGESNFPFSENVLEMMRGLSGAEFIVFDAAGHVVSSTLPDELAGRLDPAALPRGDERFSLDNASVIIVGRVRYFASTVRRRRADAATLLVLYPETSWRQARSDAVVPPLIVGGLTLLVTAAVSGWLAHRFSRRIRRVEAQVAAIAGGHFQEIPADPRHDEIRDLAVSVNRMSRQLRDQQETIRRTERTRLLGQLAGGLAHQLRNAVTGARLAVQIHRRRAAGSGVALDGAPPNGATDDSLDVALRQLALMEEQVKGLLSLGRPEHRTPEARSVHETVEEVSALVGPSCQHAGVGWSCEIDSIPPCRLGDAARIRTALVNLVLNAIDAAGPGGDVALCVRADGRNVTFDVSDSGAGPPASVADSLFDLFVTDKPEGVGIGLAMAKRVAEECEGQLAWSRDGGRTHFRLTVPATRDAAEVPAIAESW